MKVDTFGTGSVDDELLALAIQDSFDLRPKAIIEALDLLKPIYPHTAYHKHFGRAEFAWERTDRAEAILTALRRQNVA